MKILKDVSNMMELNDWHVEGLEVVEDNYRMKLNEIYTDFFGPGNYEALPISKRDMIDDAVRRISYVVKDREMGSAYIERLVRLRSEELRDRRHKDEELKKQEDLRFRYLRFKYTSGRKDKGVKKRIDDEASKSGNIRADYGGKK